MSEVCGRSCEKGSEMADEAVGKQEGCKLETLDGKACGRVIHPAPEYDMRAPVCLMHSNDPKKSAEEFQAEFERILSQAKQENSKADFFRFKFPASDYIGRVFEVECDFTVAEFMGDAN